MANATLTSKGQTTILKKILDSLGLKPQDRLNFTLTPDGTLIMQVKNRTLIDLAGIAGDTGPLIALKDMKAWRG